MMRMSRETLGKRKRKIIMDRNKAKSKRKEK